MNGLEKYWYRIAPLHVLLWPLSLLFGALAALRRGLYRSDMLRSVKLPVSVIVVGNISVGGTGKTPFVLWLAQQLIDDGWHPAIISRGYTRSKQTPINTPHEVQMGDFPSEVGDEPLLMRQREVCPVWIGRDRPAVAQAVLQAYPACDVILSDDGLQHYRLQRDVEVVLVDGKRRFGNGLLLPAGPLREPESRLSEVDFVVINGGEVTGKRCADQYAMSLEGTMFYNLLNPSITVPASAFVGQRVHALAGIGHPQRFFSQLERMGLRPQTHVFADHHDYVVADIAYPDADAILMTEKDAVKCTSFATEQCWVLRVDAHLDAALAQLIIEKIKP